MTTEYNAFGQERSISNAAYWEYPLVKDCIQLGRSHKAYGWCAKAGRDVRWTDEMRAAYMQGYNEP